MTPSPRFHGLDALRATALFLGIVLHGLISFLPNANYFWFAHDVQATSLTAPFFFAIHQFRMPLFFILAGFFAHYLFLHKGLRGFIKNRSQRVGFVLLAAWPIIYGGLVAAILYAASLKNNAQSPAINMPNPKFTYDDFPLAHLWFLYILFWLYALLTIGYVIIYRVFPRLYQSISTPATQPETKIPVSVRFHAVVLLACLIGAWLLYKTSYWAGWFGIPTPDRSLVPKLAAITNYGLFFSAGYLLYFRMQYITYLKSHWGLHILIGALACGVCLWIQGITPRLVPYALQPEKFIYAFLYLLGAWYFCAGLIGACLRYLTEERPAITYLSRASYWVYLIHLPIVIALQAFVMKAQLPVLLKIGFVIFGTLFLCLITYHFLVRKTWVGYFLNGRKP